MLVRALAASSLLFLTACGGGGQSPMAPSSPPPPPTPSPVLGAVVVRTATLRGSNGHRSEGRVDIVNDGGAFRLEFRSDFLIDRGTVDVYLSRQPDRLTESDRNLGNLSSTSGAQSYALADDGTGYSHVLLWCRPFRIPIAFGELR